MNDTTTDIGTIAREVSEWFETAQRYEGEPGKDVEDFVRIKDGAPEWVTSLVYDAHGTDFLPDDWRYKTISAALNWIADSDDPEDTQGEFADTEVDIYSHARTEWLNSNLNRAWYCDDAVSEFGQSPEKPDIIAAIGLGQYMEASEIYGLVMQALEEIAASAGP